MTANKKALRKQKDSKRRKGNKATATKRASVKKKLAVKRKPAKTKTVAKSKTAARKLVKSKKAPKKAPKKAAAKTKTVTKKLGPRRASAVTKLAPDESQMPDTALFSATRHSGSQSGDLQGLSGVESADSESVDELLEEGNAFEAGIVMGVENSGDGDPEEVRTHQVPEDDVPREYLDND